LLLLLLCASVLSTASWPAIQLLLLLLRICTTCFCCVVKNAS
jgi:hypothetical protein